MWQHNYDPLGSPLLSTLVAAVPIVVLLIMIGVLRKPAWMSALGRPRHGTHRRDRGVRHASRSRRELRADGRRIRPAADRLDRLLGRRALPHHARDRQLRGHQGLDRRPDEGPAAAGDADRVRVRRVRRGCRRVRHAGRGRRRHADGARILAVLRRRHLPAREHGARRVRLDRHSRSSRWPARRASTSSRCRSGSAASARRSRSSFRPI